MELRGALSQTSFTYKPIRRTTFRSNAERRSSLRYLAETTRDTYILEYNKQALLLGCISRTLHKLSRRYRCKAKPAALPNKWVLPLAIRWASIAGWRSSIVRLPCQRTTMMIGCVRAHGRVSPFRCLTPKYDLREPSKVTSVCFTSKETSPQVPSTVNAPDHTRALKACCFIFKLFDLACELDPQRNNSSPDLLLQMKRASKYQKRRLQWYCLHRKSFLFPIHPARRLSVAPKLRCWIWKQHTSQIVTYIEEKCSRAAMCSPRIRTLSSSLASSCFHCSSLESGPSLKLQKTRQ